MTQDGICGARAPHREAFWGFQLREDRAGRSPAWCLPPAAAGGKQSGQAPASNGGDPDGESGRNAAWWVRVGGAGSPGAECGGCQDLRKEVSEPKMSFLPHLPSIAHFPRPSPAALSKGC
ncbi:hypothetical protein AAY473_026797 [Plecturocebus cupreus]